MTTITRMTPRERKAYLNAERNRRARALVYAFLCWLECQLVDAPARIRRAFGDFVVCFICLALAAALFFALLGLLDLSISFWLSTYFGY